MDQELNIGLKDKEDFIKNLKIDQNCVLISTESNHLSIQTEDNVSNLQFATPIYDSLLVDQNHLVVSMKGMPIGFYEMKDRKWKNSVQLHDIKPNSETFLAPLQFGYRADYQDIVGCGKGFLHSYNLEKLAIHNYKCVSNTEQLSALEVPRPMQSNTKTLALLGQFNKVIKVVDLQEDTILCSLKVHIGGITHLQFDPSNSLQFYSGARFDDLIYQWDLRNYSTFLKYFHRKNSTNQRTNFSVDVSQRVLVGNDDGTAYLYENDTMAQIQICPTPVCVNSAQLHNSSAYFAYGQRSFTDQISPTGVIKTSID